MAEEKKKYDFKEVEEKLKKFWEEEKIYKTDLSGDEKFYSIDTPPPYISGAMHIGHAFSYAQQDFIARFKRMNGKVFYPFGTDDNGLPTERYVEKIHKIKSKSMKRSEFIELCLKTIREMTPKFIQDYKDLAISADYEMNYSTIDKKTQKVSQKYFLDLYKKGEIYKKAFPTLWCPSCQTTIAQAELEDKEEKSFFTTLKFECDGEELPIATTRPELLEACVAVFVNPSDEKRKHCVGKKAKVPLFGFEVPIIADESADPEKGTGVLMVCSYGDKYDAEAIARYDLEAKQIIGKDGKMKEGRYNGLKIEEARKKILEDLKENGFVIEQKEISHVVNVHDKCGTPIEFVETDQWFIKLLDKKDKLIEQGKKVKWYPEFMFKRYENWVKGLEWDWSVSRERHFGVPIPLWICEKCGEVVLPNDDELPVDPLEISKKCPKCGAEAKGESRVLDTWATSSLTPQIASELTGGKIKIPFSLRPQAHDIIRTWAFYTIARSYMSEEKIPWEDIMVSGFVTLGGEKMSKSKGRGVSPREVIEKYGADALRFWAAGSKLGNDLDYQEQDILAGKRTITKLWNASKFVFMNLKDYDGKSKPEKLVETDEVLLNKLNSVLKNSTHYFEKYEYSKAKMEIENFFWKDFCDNYLEIVKKRVYNETGDKKLSAQYTLYNALLSILKAFAPIMPFITEEIYQTYYKDKEKDKSIHVSKWPSWSEEEKDFSRWEKIVEILAKVRQKKSEAQKSMKAEIKLTLPKENIEMLGEMKEDFLGVVNAVELNEGDFEVEFV